MLLQKTKQLLLIEM